MPVKYDPYWTPPRALFGYAILYASAAFAMARGKGGGHEDPAFLEDVFHYFLYSLLPVAILLALVQPAWCRRHKMRTAIMLLIAAGLSLSGFFWKYT
jgi:hypothetical protein